MKRAFLCAVALCAAALAAAPFNKNVHAAELAQLAAGEPVIRSIPSVKKAGIAETQRTERILLRMRKLNPSFAAEIMQVKPYQGNEDLLDRLDEILSDIPGYTGIPYYSERQEKMYELYDSAEVLDCTTYGTETTRRARLDMSVFGAADYEIFTEKTVDSYFYAMKNLEKLRYRNKFNAVGAEKMQSAIAVFRDGDSWVLYAMGGVAVPRTIFFDDRIETSIINRITSFCNYVFEKL